VLAYEKGQACLLFVAAVVVVSVAAEMVGVVVFLLLKASLFVLRILQMVAVGAYWDCRLLRTAVADLPSSGMVDLVAVAFGCCGTLDLSSGYSCLNPELAEDLPCAEHCLLAPFDETFQGAMVSYHHQGQAEVVLSHHCYYTYLHAG
jgi:hypothetical protein